MGLAGGVYGASRAALLVACLSLVPVAGAPVQAQGLFEFLFGVQPAPQITIRPGPYRPNAAPVVRRPRLEAPQGPRKYIPPEVVSGPLGQFLHDPTLRRGDVVATTKGLMVYQGPGGSRHSPSDFAPVSRAVAGGRRGELMALDATVRRQPVQVHAAPVTVTPAASGEVAALTPAR